MIIKPQSECNLLYISLCGTCYIIVVHLMGLYVGGLSGGLSVKVWNLFDEVTACFRNSYTCCVGVGATLLLCLDNLFICIQFKVVTKDAQMACWMGGGAYAFFSYLHKKRNMLTSSKVVYFSRKQAVSLNILTQESKVNWDCILLGRSKLSAMLVNCS